MTLILDQKLVGEVDNVDLEETLWIFFVVILFLLAGNLTFGRVASAGSPKHIDEE